MAKQTRTPVHQQRISIRANFSLLLLPAVALPAALYALWLLSERLVEQGGSHLEWQWWAGLSAIFLAFPLWGFFRTRMARYRFYDDRLIDERGILGRDSAELRLKDIQNIQIRQTFLQRLLWIGDITFTTAAGQSLTFHGISRPKRARELVDELRDGRRPAWLLKREAKKEAKQLPASSSASADAAAGSKTSPATSTPAPSGANQARSAASAATAASAKSAAVSETGTPGAGAPGASAAPAASSTSRPAASPQPATSSAAGDDGTRDELWRLLAEQEADEEEKS